MKELIISFRVSFFWAFFFFQTLSCFSESNAFSFSFSRFSHQTLLSPARTSSITVKSDTMKLISFNVYFRPIRSELRTQRTIEIFQKFQPNIIALQEVSEGWFGAGKNPAVRIAKELHFFIEQCEFESFKPFFSSGLAILSKWPIQKKECHQFDKNNMFNTKGFMKVDIDSPFGKIVVVNVHLAATQKKSIKHPQMEQLVTFLNALNHDMPLFLVGDFNEMPESEELIFLFEKVSGLQNLYSFFEIKQKNTASSYGNACDDSDGHRVDYIYFSGMTASQLLSGQIYSPLPPYPSDHCMIIGNFAFSSSR